MMWNFIFTSYLWALVTLFSKFSITNSFTDVIGQGGYATVFLGKTHGQNLQLAIKKLKVGATAKERDEMERQLNYQVDEFERYIPHLKAIFLLFIFPIEYHGHF